jgi:hypothetical protein
MIFLEHIGDTITGGKVVGKNFFKSPGLHGTLIVDGLATIFCYYAEPCRKIWCCPSNSHLAGSNGRSQYNSFWYN